MWPCDPLVFWNLCRSFTHFPLALPVSCRTSCGWHVLLDLVLLTSWSNKGSGLASFTKLKPCSGKGHCWTMTLAGNELRMLKHATGASKLPENPVKMLLLIQSTQMHLWSALIHFFICLYLMVPSAKAGVAFFKKKKISSYMRSICTGNDQTGKQIREIRCDCFILRQCHLLWVFVVRVSFILGDTLILNFDNRRVCFFLKGVIEDL